MPPHIDRRTVLQTTGGLLAGTTAIAGTGRADDFEGGLQMDVRREVIDPERDDTITVEVDPPDLEFDPDAVLVGVRDAFQVIGVVVTITPEFQDGVATPVRFYPEPDSWLLQYATDDIRYPGPDGWDGTLGLGVFAEEACEGCSDVATEVRYWDHDTVRVPPRGTDN